MLKVFGDTISFHLDCCFRIVLLVFFLLLDANCSLLSQLNTINCCSTEVTLQQQYFIDLVTLCRNLKFSCAQTYALKRTAALYPHLFTSLSCQQEKT